MRSSGLTNAFDSRSCLNFAAAILAYKYFGLGSVFLIIVQCFTYNLRFADTVASATEVDFVLAHNYQASIGA